MRRRKPLNTSLASTMTLNRVCYLLLIFAAIGSLFTSSPLAMWFLLINMLTLVMYGQQLFRHKTQKQPFKTYFFLSIVVSIAVMAAVYHFSPVSYLWPF